MNSELHWFHFGCPLMLLLLYNVVAGLRRNQVGPPKSRYEASLPLTDRIHVYLQLLSGPLDQDAEGAESTASQSYDITTATSDLSEEALSTLGVETRRQLWRRSHHQVRPFESPPTETTYQ